jgi:hypothetical protein
MPDKTPVVASLRDKVQARRAEMQQNTTETFDVPGYEGILRVRYRVLSWKEIERIGERVAKIKDLDGPTSRLYVMADTLVVASEAVYDASLDADRKDGDAPPEGPRWGAALAHDLGFPDPQTARQGIFAIFARDTQLVTHYQTMMAWQEGENERIGEDLAGESEPPQPSS